MLVYTRGESNNSSQICILYRSDFSWKLLSVKRFVWWFPSVITIPEACQFQPGLKCMRLEGLKIWTGFQQWKRTKGLFLALFSHLCSISSVMCFHCCTTADDSLACCDMWCEVCCMVWCSVMHYDYVDLFHSSNDSDNEEFPFIFFVFCWMLLHSLALSSTDSIKGLEQWGWNSLPFSTGVFSSPRSSVTEPQKSLSSCPSTLRSLEDHLKQL